MATTGAKLAQESVEVSSELIDFETKRGNLQYLTKNYPVDNLVLCYSLEQIRVMLWAYFEEEGVGFEEAQVRVKSALSAIERLKNRSTARGRKKA